MPGRQGRSSLRQGLDRDVYQITRDIIDKLGDVRTSTVVSSLIYDQIQKSNSSLRRKPKRVLEDSIERVLAVLHEDEEISEEIPDEVDDLGRQAPAPPSNAMNRSIVGAWKNVGAPSPGTPSEYTDRKQKRDKEGRDAQTNGEPARKKRKPATEEVVDRSPPAHYKLVDIGGLDQVKEQLSELLVLPLIRPQKYMERKIPVPRGVLLHGPPGCGKTVLVRAMAATIGVPYIEIIGPSIVSGMSGESEKQVRDLFEEARRLAPCIVFIDEIDVIAPKRESSQSQMEKRIVAQMLGSMDKLAPEENDGKPVIVLAATNRPDSIDPALRRGGRFDTEINIGVPNERMREQILRALTRDVDLSSDVDFAQLAKMTAGFVGADLRDLVGKAGAWSMDQYRKALQQQAQEMETDMDVDDAKKADEVTLKILRLVKRARQDHLPEPPGFEDKSLTMEAFLTVFPGIQPSSKREGFATIPDTTWADIGALEDVRSELRRAIVEPIKDPDVYETVGITVPSGVLLWGPPGCGKTVLAKAVANESKANFISVKGPELLNKYVGESERAVRQVFTRARSSVPCVIFFDELDALVPRRDDAMSEASARVVNTLLVELDGLDARGGIYVIAATNRPDVIDPAMLRPGRLETLLFVGLPGPQEREEILRTLLRQKKLDQSLAQFGSRANCDGLTGADLGSLVRRAGLKAIERGSRVVELVDFENAMVHVRPSVGDMKKYEKLREKLATRT